MTKGSARFSLMGRLHVKGLQFKGLAKRFMLDRRLFNVESSVLRLSILPESKSATTLNPIYEHLYVSDLSLEALHHHVFVWVEDTLRIEHLLDLLH